MNKRRSITTDRVDMAKKMRLLVLSLAMVSAALVGVPAANAMQPALICSEPDPAVGVRVESLTNEGNADSSRPVVSADGSIAVFHSEASNLTLDDKDIMSDIFVADRVSGEIANLTAIRPGWSRHPSVSDDGSVIVFESGESASFESNTIDDIVIWDQQTGAFTNITDSADGPSAAPAVSPDGSFVVFETDASNLVSGVETSVKSVILWERASGEFTNVTLTGDGDSAEPSVSANGSFVVFTSRASNLTPSGNPDPSVIVWDRATGEFVRLDGNQGEAVSYSPVVSGDGSVVVFVDQFIGPPDLSDGANNVIVWERATGEITQITRGGDGFSRFPSVSQDGSVVSFHSEATNLTPQGVIEDTSNVFVWKRLTNELTSITEGAAGSSSYPAISADGTVVVFQSDASNLVADDTRCVMDVFAFEVAPDPAGPTESGPLTNETGRGNGSSGAASVSADGSVVAFTSFASTLTPGDDNARQDAFVLDRNTGALTNLSEGTDSWVSASPVVSGDGSVVVYGLGSSLISWDRATGETATLSENAGPRSLSLSSDGSFVVFHSFARDLTPDEVGGGPNIFMWERASNQFTLITKGANATSRYPSITADGAFVALSTNATNLTPVDGLPGAYILLWERETAEFTLVSKGGGRRGSEFPSISADGSVVVFSSEAQDLVPLHDTEISDVFVWQRETGELTKVASGAVRASRNPAVSADGRFVTFNSSASDLTPADTDGFEHVFRWERATGQYINISEGGQGSSGDPAISADGSVIVFNSAAWNLTPEDTNGWQDVFVWVEDIDPVDPAGSTVENAETVAEVVEASDYNNGSHAEVLRLYQAIFGRYPDLIGAKYWISVNNNGPHVLDIAGYMSDSKEWANNYNNTTDEQFVTKVYSNVLGRDYDQAGFDYWLGLVQTEQLQRHEMVYYVTANTEFISKYPFTSEK